MFGLLLETERCSDGVALIDGYFQPRSDRREPVRIVSDNIDHLVVLDFVNARDDLAPFFSRYSPGTPPAQIIAADRQKKPRRGAAPSSWATSWPYHPLILHGAGMKFLQEQFRQALGTAGSGDPIKAVVAVGYPLVDVKAAFHLERDKLQMLLHCQDLMDLWRMEVARVALEGVKAIECEHCRSYFLAGPSTSRRSDSTYCSDRCRVAAMRSRKESQ